MRTMVVDRDLVALLIHVDRPQDLESETNDDDGRRQTTNDN